MWYKECNLEILHVGFKIKLVLHQHRHFHPTGGSTAYPLQDLNWSLKTKVVRQQKKAQRLMTCVNTN